MARAPRPRAARAPKGNPGTSKGNPGAPKSPRARWKTWALRLLLGLGLLLLAVAVYLSISVFWLRSHTPSTSSFRELRESQGVATRGATFVPLSAISPNLIRAVLAGEDQRFWEHGGFDINAIQKAAVKDLTEGEVIRGGSTITQQLAKNLYLGEERSLLRKGEEAFVTLLLEAMLPKVATHHGETLGKNLSPHPPRSVQL